MAEDSGLRVGQIGALLSVEMQSAEVPLMDLSDATLTEIICLLPDKTEVAFPATLNGTKLEYVTTSADDLPLPKTYKIHAHVAGPGYDMLGEMDSFTVLAKWK